MATFVPYASCYGNKQAVQLLGRNSYFSLFANPPCLISQRQRLACQAPEMTLRQITQLIRVLRQLNLRDAKGNQLPKSQRAFHAQGQSVQVADWGKAARCGISQWNSLPQEVAMASGLDTFKRGLDKFLEEKSTTGDVRAVPPQNLSSPGRQTSTASPASIHDVILVHHVLGEDPCRPKGFSDYSAGVFGRRRILAVKSGSASPTSEEDKM